MIKIYIIVEDTAIDTFEFEHGLSIGIESAGKKLLFDTGASDLLLRNAQRLDFCIDSVDAVILSHAHYDHTNGLKYIADKKLIAHPDSFNKTYAQNDRRYIGTPLSELECRRKFDMLLTTSPYYITDDIIFLGEIPRSTEFEGKQTAFITKDGDKDYVISDSAIVIKTSEGNVLVTGCSHSGIINIIQYAKQVTGDDRFKAVIGGFHLLEVDQLTLQTVKRLKDESIETLYPMHCTAKDVIEYMMSKLDNVSRTNAGCIITIDN